MLHIIYRFMLFYVSCAQNYINSKIGNNDAKKLKIMKVKVKADLSISLRIFEDLERS